MKPTILCYAKLSYTENPKRKTPRYDCTAFAGYYPPFEELKNPKGELFFYLQGSHKNSNRKDGSNTPEMFLQGSKNSINFTGLYHYWEDGKLSGFCLGYPSQKEMLGGKKPFMNPFYKSNRDDCFLFIMNHEKDKETPSSIEVIVLKDARVLVDAYRKQLMLGGFDAELNSLRQQAKTITF